MRQVIHYSPSDIVNDNIIITDIIIIIIFVITIPVWNSDLSRWGSASYTDLCQNSKDVKLSQLISLQQTINTVTLTIRNRSGLCHDVYKSSLIRHKTHLSFIIF